MILAASQFNVTHIVMEVTLHTIQPYLTSKTRVRAIELYDLFVCPTLGVKNKSAIYLHIIMKLSQKL